MKLTRNVATLCGLLAMFFWAAGTTMVMFLAHIPVAQMLAISWGICFLFYAAMLTIKNEWHKIKQPWYVWLVGILGLCGTHCAVVCSLKITPPGAAHVLTTLWPIIVALASGWILKEKGAKRFLLSALIGFSGVWFLITEGNGFPGYKIQYTEGYLLAILSSVLWASYIIMSRKFQQVPPEMVGMYSGVGAVLAFIVHICCEDFVTPTMGDWTLLLLKSLTTSVIAYYCWDVGIKKGNLALLSILYYFNSLAAILILIYFKFATPTKTLLISSAIIIFATWICSGIKLRQLSVQSIRSKR